MNRHLIPKKFIGLGTTENEADGQDSREEHPGQTTTDSIIC